jgi:hypothetical protein
MKQNESKPNTCKVNYIIKSDDITPDEENALRKIVSGLKTLSKYHWIFAAPHDLHGGLYVMKYKDPITKERGVTPTEGMDTEYIAAVVYGCEIDGGDW